MKTRMRANGKFMSNAQVEAVIAALTKFFCEVAKVEKKLAPENMVYAIWLNDPFQNRDQVSLPDVLDKLIEDERRRQSECPREWNSIDMDIQNTPPEEFRESRLRDSFARAMAAVAGMSQEQQTQRQIRNLLYIIRTRQGINVPETGILQAENAAVQLELLANL